MNAPTVEVREVETMIVPFDNMAPARLPYATTRLPGLVLVMAIDHDTMQPTGRWSLTHQASGMSAARGLTFDWFTAEELVDRYSAYAVDWTQPFDALMPQLEPHIPHLSRQINEARLGML